MLLYRPLRTVVSGFDIQDHTADIAVAATGADPGEALAWLARGMFSVIAEMDGVRSQEAIEFSISARDLGSLTVDWLNELLYRYEAEGFIPKDFRVAVDSRGNALRAWCSGERADPERHTILLGVKAATYHALEISHDGEWHIRVVLDV